MHVQRKVSNDAAFGTRNRYVSVLVRRVLKETEKAILVDFAMDVEAWIPKSQIHEDDKCLYWRGLTNREINIKEWLAVELELL